MESKPSSSYLQTPTCIIIGRQINSVHTTPSYFCSGHFNIIIQAEAIHLSHMLLVTT